VPIFPKLLPNLRQIDRPLIGVLCAHFAVKYAKGALLQAVRFTDDEALVLALGLKGAQKMGDPQLAAAAASAFRRLEHVLTEPLSERLKAVLENVAAEAKPERSAKVASGTFLTVAEAVQQRQRLELRYRSQSNSFTYRKLDPYGVAHVNRQWYVTGYCHLREDTRVFRLDRLEVLDVLSEDFTVPADFDALEAVSSSLAQAPYPDGISCRIWLGTTLDIASQHVPSYVATFEPQDDGMLLMGRIHPNSLGRIALYLLAFPAPVKVLEPAALRKAFTSLSQRTQALSKGKCA